MARNQQDLLNKMDDKLSQLFAKFMGAEKGKVHETHEIDSSPIPRGPQDFPPRVTFSATTSSNVGVNPAKVPDLDDPKELEKLRLGQPKYSDIDDDKFKYLEERIKAMEGTDAFAGTDLMELSLVPDLILPQNFKVPEFEKFDGTSCPTAHLTMFCRKMTGYGNDDKLLIHCFQDSLTGSAMRWYNQLSRSQVGTWRDLARAFKEQYKHAMDMVPDRLSLQGIEKKDKESFREYAQRWRNMAAQVQPPLLEKETTTLFIKSLETAPMFYAKLVGSTTRDFADLVAAGEAIERAIKSGKLSDPEVSKKAYAKKRENDVNMVGHDRRSYSNYQSSPKVTYSTGYPKNVTTSLGSQNQQREPRSSKPGTEKESFTPIPIPYKELYANLLEERLVSPVFLTPFQPPYPAWYDPSAQCEYHAGIRGHSIENCTAFKRRVQHLINQKVIQVNAPKGPNVANNPLPTHDEPRVNVVMNNGGIKIKKSLYEVLSPLKWVWKEMVKRGLVNPKPEVFVDNEEVFCEYHGEVGHEIQFCDPFRVFVQSLMDNKEIEFFERGQEVGDIFVLEEQSCKKGYVRPFVINWPQMNEERPKQPLPRIVIEAPSPFPYQNSHQVPWVYGSNMTIPKSENSEIAATGFSGVGNFTRSGRCYSPNTSEPVEIKDAGEKGQFSLNGGTSEINEPVKEEEAREFLKFIKHSEYNVVEQLHKQPARISVLTLLLSSELHRNALLRVLNQTFVPNDVSVEKLDRLVNNLHADNFISFSEDEIPPDGVGSTKALHITTHCNGHILPHVLVDNGSALNVMPMTTLNRLPIDKSHMRPCHTSVRAFDGTRREVMGKIDVPLLIGPATYNVEFVIMDIIPAYNCLLGRPWIHAAGAVPSTLHQKLKFVIEGRLVSVGAEEDIIASMSTEAPYIDIDENALECTFRSLEFVNATFVAERRKIPKPKLSRNTMMGVKLTVGKGARSGKGLGKFLQGMCSALQPTMKYDRSGVGYKHDPRQKMKQILKKREQRRARLIGQSIEEEPMQFPHIFETFVSGGHIFSEKKKNKALVLSFERIQELSINVVGDEEEVEKDRSKIRPCPPGCVLNNWTAVELPVVFRTLNE
ncbi:hypothetical protein GQ457_07G009110 [Hibiscus cannabinus]